MRQVVVQTGLAGGAVRYDAGMQRRDGTMASGARATPAQMRRQHIFVVNGSVEFLDVVRELLQEERYNVTTTNFVPRTFHQRTAVARHRVGDGALRRS
jgi:hypothetical protein